MAEEDFHGWMRERQAHFERVAQEAIPPGTAFPGMLHEAMRWSVLGGGKRVRPLLAYAAAEVTRAREKDADAVALALECIHSYSLVHDDLPCMDNDMMRHGKASTHAKFGFAEAVLAGDALQAEAFAVLARGIGEGAKAAALCGLLAEAAGSRGMCGGQAVDLALTGKRSGGVGLEELRRLHAMKTGALIRAAVLMGAECGDGAIATRARPALSEFGSRIGLAFQVIDDILDVTGDAATLGKTAGKDEAEGKPTYVSLLGLEEARRLARESCEAALPALDEAGAVPGAGSTRRLSEIARYIVRRDH